MKNDIIKILDAPPTKFCTFKQLQMSLGIDTSADKAGLDNCLKNLISSGDVVFNKKSKRYYLSSGDKTIKATIIGNSKGYAFANAENFANDFFIAPRNLEGALHKDEVLITPIGKDEAKVEKILRRGISEVVGRYDKQKGSSWVVCDDSKFATDVYIPFRKDCGAESGQRVVAKIISYPKNGKPIGEITKVLGDGNDLDVMASSIALSHDLEIQFDQRVLDAAEKIKQVVEKVDIDGRLDLRQEIIFTIDGADARDLDDAVSVVRTEEGGWQLGVHIADVSHYVNKNDLLDKEAEQRGTSVYFPNMVLPMLPKQLSNGICSLNENVDRLTLSAFITYDANAQITAVRCDNSVIHSKKRFTYEEVQAIMDGGEYADKQIEKAVKEMSQLYLKLKKQRQEAGSIDFNTKEIGFEISGNDITKAYAKARLPAHNLIEEFMIAANVQVARYIINKKMPCVFRIHDKPSNDKIREINTLLKSLDLPVVTIGNKLNSLALSKVISAVKEPYVNVVNTVILRAMQKARYSTFNIGHFGLSEAEYCHFTSPIRRYPDLLVHRLLKQILEKNFKTNSAQLEELAAQSSINERKALEAERDVVDLFSCVYAKNLIGQNFDGIISGVTSFGIFVELESGIEGMIKISDLDENSIVVDAEKYLAEGKNHSYRLGDKIAVQVESVDMSNKRILFLPKGAKSNFDKKPIKDTKAQPVATSKKTKTDKSLTPSTTSKKKKSSKNFAGNKKSKYKN